MKTNNFFEALEAMERQEATDRWLIAPKRNFAVKELPNAPIVAETFTGLDSDVDHIRQGMEETHLRLTYIDPEGQSNVDAPLNAHGANTLCELIGLGCPSIKKIKDDSRFDALPDEFRMQVINTVLPHWHDGLKSLHRNGMIRFCGSDQYAIMPAAELMNSLNDALETRFPYASFLDFASDDEFVVASYDLADDELKGKLAEALGEGYTPVLKFVTSDVGKHNATIFPVAVNLDGDEFPIGAPLVYEHRLPHKAEEFGSLVVDSEGNSKVFAMFTEAAEKISSLKDIIINFPKGCFISLAKNMMNKSCLRLPTARLVADTSFTDFEGAAGGMVTGFDIYCALSAAVKSEIDSRPCVSVAQRIGLNEALARVVLCDFNRHDHADTWPSDKE